MSDNGTTLYRYRNAVGGFFDFPVEQARAILPKDLHPVELHHGSAILSVMAFDFTESEVGAYKELILGILVSPRVEPGTAMPHSAFYPYLLGTTTTASREHAIERWHLPHFMKDIGMSMEVEGEGSDRERLVVKAWDEGTPIAELTITSHGWRQAEQNHQSFMRDDEGTFLAQINMAGGLSENEEEAGRLKLFPHPMTDPIGDLDEVNELPLREIWMRDGVQTFQPLRVLSQAAGV
ncbi:MAG: hypothetical protein JWM27_5006 [Gemmatimonadetes bacterium]|nr:hypothetical protein [Gemmatimonadota bacterium]